MSFDIGEPVILEGTPEEIEAGKETIMRAVAAVRKEVGGDGIGFMVIVANFTDEPVTGGARVMFGSDGLGHDDVVQLMLGWVARNARPEDFDRFDREHPRKPD
jgi:hypothetical protein